MLQTKAGTPSPAHSDASAAVEAVYRLSPMQSGVLFHALEDPEPAFYLEQVCYTLEGDVDPGRFERAWQRVVDRHSVLRTAFSLSRGMGQVVFRSVTLRIHTQDWTRLDPDGHKRLLHSYLVEDRRRGFDLSKAPLMRLALMRLDDETHYFVWTFHHILLDGWSTMLVLKEVLAQYEAYVGGEPLELPPPRPYQEYIAWLQRQDMRAAEAFWRRTLQGFTAPTSLPVDRREAGEDRGARKEHVLRVPASLVRDVQAAARREKVTLNTVIQATWALLLSRYSGQSDVVFGATVAGRPPDLPGVETMVGLFINTLPVRVRVAAGERVGPWLRALQQQQAEAQQHEHTPLVDIQGWSDVPRGSPLFESLLVFENFPEDAFENTYEVGVSSMPFRVRQRETIERLNYALVLVARSDAELALRIAYDCSRYSAETIERFMQQIVATLQSIAADEMQQLGDLPLLEAREQQQLLTAWCAGAEQPVANECVMAPLERQAALTPDAVAVVCGAHHLSYAELHRRATAVAQRLAALGVRPDMRVAVCADRGPELIVGILGVLKAGGTYVPIDLSYPPDRIGSMLREAGAGALVTASADVARGARDVPAVDPLSPPADLEDTSRAGAAVPQDEPERLLYAIFTSGSTGTPKAAAVRHRGFLNLLTWYTSEFEIGPDDRVGLVSSPSFDLTQKNFFAPLITGGTLCLYDSPYDPETLAAFIAEQRISIVNCTPSTFIPVVQAARDREYEELSSVRLVVLGGEPFGVAPFEEWMARRSSPVEIANTYGPTECTDIATFHRVKGPSTGAVTSSVPIGKPIPNVQVFVVGPGMELLPPGATGEVCIQGIGVGAGYLNDAALTQRKFVQSPVGAIGARMYRTGDVGRWTSAGELAFVGRQDEQVKIRGHRVEPGEVEAALRQEPEVRDAVVVGRPTPGGEGQRLVAYVVAAGAGTTLSGLRRRLTERLPGYLVPSVVVPIAQVPLTPNGKVDRQALPAPEETAAEVETAYVAPRTEAEARLGEIWGRLLGVARVGVHDNFFELGGDSILSVQVVAWARRAGLVLTTRQVFQHQTVAALAAVARSEGGSAARQDTVTGPVAVTPVQQWFFEQAGAAPHHFNQSVLLTAKAALDGACLATAVTQLLAHHDALRMRFWRDGAGWHQENAAAEPARVVATVDLREVGEAAVAAVAAQVQASLDLARGPLVRVVALRRPGEVWQVLLVIHHLVVDGVSWRILLEDLQRLYGAARRGEAAALGAKTTAFQQWAAALRQYAGTGVVRAERAFWSRQRQAGRVPRDHETGANTVGSTATVVSELAAAATTALLQQVPKQAGAPVQAVLLTALADAVAPWSGTAGVGVELEGHGREDIAEGLDVSRTVGWFTTLYPVWLPWAAEAAPLARVQAVQAQLRAIPRGGIGYGVLRYLSADAGRPVVEGRGLEVSFNYLGQFDQLFTGETLWEPALAASGPEQPPARRRPHVLAVTSHIVGGRLRTVWTYSTHLHRPATIAQLAARFTSAIDQIIRHSQSAAVEVALPDGGDTQLTSRELDRLVRRLEGGRAS